MDITTVFTWVTVFFRLVIGLQLTRLALQRNLPQFHWLAVSFYLVIPATFVMAGAYENPFGYGILGAVLQLAVTVFIRQMFYQGRRSPFPWILGIQIILGLGRILTGGPLGAAGYAWSYFLGGVMGLVNWGWHTLAAYEAYTKIAGDPHVEDWVKGRYQYMIAYCVCFVLTQFSIIAKPFAPATGPIFGGLAAWAGLTNLLAIGLTFLVWIMPEAFRQFLNRNYRAQPKVALSEEELLRELGSPGTGGQPPAAGS